MENLTKASMQLRSIRLACALLVLAGALGGCGQAQDPWDRSGYFKQQRTRTEAQSAELRQRAQRQQDRTLGYG